MTRLAIDPARAAAEMTEFCGRLATAVERLAGLDLRAEGCSARDASFRVDKTVLWRYRPQAALFGSGELDYALLETFYDHAAPTVDRLTELGIVDYLPFIILKNRGIDLVIISTVLPNTVRDYISPLLN